jgi:ABC-type antimicrobial peptide transport system permease subunit
MNKKGQLSIINIIFFVILAVMMAVMTPIVSGIIGDTITTNNITGMSATIMNFIVPMMWLALIVTLFLYVSPIRPQQF